MLVRLKPLQRVNGIYSSDSCGETFVFLFVFIDFVLLFSRIFMRIIHTFAANFNEPN
ncbi:hypothetical protein SJDPG11_05150 [Porphyromonas gingivalis SJD11]|nr:hypothetical protein SJDPG4_04480 [Porphyromonas gingivalis SJD4]OWR79408.1 hypothetical protein SJDPG11_05150 [Porphyromonas gingivalis SJD11]